MNVVFGEIRNRMGWWDTVITYKGGYLRGVPNVRRQGGHDPRIESDDENELGGVNEDVHISDAEVGRMRNMGKE